MASPSWFSSQTIGYIRTLMFALAFAMLPLLQLVIDVDPSKPMFLSSNECQSEVGYLDPNSFLGRVLKPITPIAFPHLRSEMCENNMNLTIDVVRELMRKNLLNYGAKPYVGQGTASTVSALSSFLKSSNVIDVMSLGSFTLVAFKKKGNNLGSFEEYRLQTNCSSIKRNKPIMGKMEPLIDKKPKPDYKRIAYLPNFVTVSNKGKLVYIDMGAKEAANFSSSNWFLPLYPIGSKDFSVFVVDHDALVLSSHVRSPGVTFIYRPALGGSVIKDKLNSYSDEEPVVGDEEFDFLVWFKETVEFADFVVLKMNMGKAEMKFLSELFQSGVICYVDDLFLQFSSAYGKSQQTLSSIHTTPQNTTSVQRHL